MRGLWGDVAEAIAAGRPYASIEDLVRRVPVPGSALESLATAGAFGCFGLDRRAALWAAGALASVRPGHLPGTAPGVRSPELPAMTTVEETIADLWATGTSEQHPMAHVRAALTERGAVPLSSVRDIAGDTNIWVGGVVTHRQRPPTAGGIIFINLEDETGMLNVVVRPPVWERYRRAAFQAQAMLIHGRLERHDGAINLIATRIQRLPMATLAKSRDFR